MTLPSCTCALVGGVYFSALSCHLQSPQEGHGMFGVSGVPPRSAMSISSGCVTSKALRVFWVTSKAPASPRCLILMCYQQPFCYQPSPLGGHRTATVLLRSCWWFVTVRQCCVTGKVLAIGHERRLMSYAQFREAWSCMVPHSGFHGSRKCPTARLLQLQRSVQYASRPSVGRMQLAGECAQMIGSTST
jgi:hypothetical protein